MVHALPLDEADFELSLGQIVETYLPTFDERIEDGFYAT
jgi:hypothetical protein